MSEFAGGYEPDMESVTFYDEDGNRLYWLDDGTWRNQDGAIISNVPDLLYDENPFLDEEVVKPATLLEENITPGMDGQLLRHSPTENGRQRWYVLYQEGMIYAKVRAGTAKKGYRLAEGHRVTFDLITEIHEGADDPRYYAEKVRPWQQKKRQR